MEPPQSPYQYLPHRGLNKCEEHRLELLEAELRLLSPQALVEAIARITSGRGCVVWARVCEELIEGTEVVIIECKGDVQQVTVTLQKGRPYRIYPR